MKSPLSAALDPKQWQRLSQLLDELLDLDADQREVRLAELAISKDSGVSTDDLQRLRQWLALEPELDAQQFLERPAAQHTDLVESLLHGHDMSGQTIGPYTLLRELGSGGMGTVWLAQRNDGHFDGHVAIKLIHQGVFSRGASARFRREGRVLARLNHPHIARLLDAGVQALPQGPRSYLVLEYVEGLPIDRYCSEHALDATARVRLVLDVLAAVAHAQQHLILHRDLKPGNILVTAAGEAKLLDFGIAMLLDQTQPGADVTQVTQLAGPAFTPEYAAPEQIQQLSATTATDVYALGVLLFTLLTGQHPTVPKHAAPEGTLNLLRALVELAPRQLSEAAGDRSAPAFAQQAARLFRGDLDTIVAKALKKNPADRYPNAAAMADDLRRWLEHQPISAQPDHPLYVFRCFVRRHRLAVSASALALAGLVGLTSVSLWQAQRANTAEQQARTAEQQAQARRQQSDDLLAYMLGDFADKLRPIGRLELLDSVGGKALSHLAANDHAPPQERLQRAKALTVIGEVRVAKRELDAAIEPLQQANALLQTEPPSRELMPAWRKAQGAAAFWLGHVAYTQRRFDAAAPAFLRYRQVSQQWLNALPDDLDALVELSYATNSLGSLWLDQGQLIEAEQAFRQSVNLKAQVLARRPQDAMLQAEWSDSLSWLGSTLLQMGRHVQAQQVLTQALQQAQALRARYPADHAWLERQGNVALTLADALWRDGQTQAAKPHFVDGVAAFRTLHAIDPKNRIYAYSLLRAEVGAQRNQPSATVVRALLERFQTLQSGRPASVRWHPLHADLVRLEARVLLLNGQHALAQTRVTSTLALLRADSIRHPTDLKLQEASLALALFEAETLSSSPEQRRQRCDSLWETLSQAPLTQLQTRQAAFTRIAMLTRTCQGQAQQAQALQAWLETQRQHTADPIPLPPLMPASKN